MSVDNHLIKKKFQGFEALYVLFSGLMRTPFIECDEETFDDQVYLFTTVEMAQEFARRYTAEKILLAAVKLEKKAIMPFVEGLYQYGVNALMLQEEGIPVRIQLDAVADRPDFESLKKEPIPRLNPELQLTAIYFMEELHRRIDRNKDEKQHLHDLEEEMAHNLLRSSFIVTFDTSAIEGEWNPRDSSQQVKIPLVKTKEGKTYQPVYTDLEELRRYNSANPNIKLGMMAVPYDRLHTFLIESSEGFVFNPGGFNLILTRGQLEEMKKRYQDA